jgi:2-hydroxychromene-2-carboxylate isomerase
VPDQPVVELFYCGSCPSSYLAFVRLRETALRTGAGIVLRPVVARWLEDEFGETSVVPVGHASAVAYGVKDLADWANYCGVRIAVPAGAVDAERAQRGAVAAIEGDRGIPYAAAMFAALFTDGRDIADQRVVIDVASSVGIPEATITEALASGHAASVLRRNTADLLKRGGFRTPTMYVGEDMYVGHERVPLIEWALMRSAEQPFIAPGEHSR